LRKKGERRTKKKAEKLPSGKVVDIDQNYDKEASAR
jgi:hypothetical protein